MGNLFLLLLAALIWGFAFVAQKVGMDYIGPFAFNGIRFLLGAFSLLPLLLFVKKLFGYSSNRHNLSITIQGGLLLGLVLFVAASFQQIGIIETTAGNSGFITSLYIIIVPFLGVFFKHKITLNVWAGAFLAVIGLYFLSVTGGFKMAQGDALVLVSAFFFAVHILLIGYYAPRTHVLLLSIIQFAVSALLSLMAALLFEKIRWSALEEAAVPLLYGGIMSIGVAYTLQVIAQRNVTASKAAIVLSLESVFAALGGILLLEETVTLRKAVGGLLVLAGIILSQLDFSGKRVVKESGK